MSDVIKRVVGLPDLKNPRCSDCLNLNLQKVKCMKDRKEFNSDVECPEHTTTLDHVLG